MTSSVALGKYMKAHITEKKPKTDVWSITDSKGVWIAEIKWYEPWRQYCFFPSNAVFNHSCILSIATFLVKLNNEHRKKRVLKK